MSLMDAALWYASQGIRVFPLQPGTKLPMRGWSWKKIATNDPETVRSWWQTWPGANIGLVMGAESGIIALDIDMKNGQDGLRSYQAIAQETFHGPVQQTPTGGQHLILAYTPGFRNFTHKGDFGGLDMRTDGGYIVAAPSTINGVGMYQWAQDGSVLPPAARLAQACSDWSNDSRTVTVESPDIPEELPDYHTLNLDQKYLNYLDRGDASAWGNDESRAIHNTAGALQCRLQDAGLVFGMMSANPYAWACAERHRPFGNVSDWLWKYGIGKMVTQATSLDPTKVFDPVPGFQEHAPPAAGRETSVEDALKSFLVRADIGVSHASMAPSWLVKGILEKGQVGILYGDSQSLKSYLMLDLAAAVSTGQEWHGHRIVNPGPVWFLAGEGNMILWRRLEALRQQRGYWHADLEKLWLSSRGLNLMDPSHLEFLRSMVTQWGLDRPGMIVIDTMSTNAILDENSAKDVSLLIKILHDLAQEWGVTIVLVHHASKSNNRSARGSSALLANTDFRVRMERVAGSGTRILTQAFIEKLKGAPEPSRPLIFEGRLNYIMGVVDEDGQPVSEMTLDRLQGAAEEEIQTARAQAKLTQDQQAVYDLAKTIYTEHWKKFRPSEPLLLEELAGRIHLLAPNRREGNIKRSIDRLINRGVLEQAHSGEHALIYMRNMLGGD